MIEVNTLIVSTHCPGMEPLELRPPKTNLRQVELDSRVKHMCLTLWHGLASAPVPTSLDAFALLACTVCDMIMLIALRWNVHVKTLKCPRCKTYKQNSLVWTHTPPPQHLTQGLNHHQKESRLWILVQELAALIQALEGVQNPQAGTYALARL